MNNAPTAGTLHAYAKHCLSQGGITLSSCATYLERIVAAYQLLSPGFYSEACDLVCAYYREQARAMGTATKTGAQLIGASCIYEHGFALMDRARGRKLRGLHAARDFRNGLLLSVAIALPQRARALSMLEFGQTIFVEVDQHVRVQLSAEALKLPEVEKDGEPYCRTLFNAGLAAALTEYRRDFRPIFDTGSWLFPSVLSRGDRVTEKSLARLAGRETEERFGVRVSIHRYRDNVATEASETLAIGARSAMVLLDHRDVRTSQRHYDHSQGAAVAGEHASFLEGKRSAPSALIL